MCSQEQLQISWEERVSRVEWNKGWGPCVYYLHFSRPHGSFGQIERYANAEWAGTRKSWHSFLLPTADLVSLSQVSSQLNPSQSSAMANPINWHWDAQRNQFSIPGNKSICFRDFIFMIYRKHSVEFSFFFCPRRYQLQWKPSPPTKTDSSCTNYETHDSFTLPTSPTDAGQDISYAGHVTTSWF